MYFLHLLQLDSFLYVGNPVMKTVRWDVCSDAPGFLVLHGGSYLSWLVVQDGFISNRRAAFRVLSSSTR